MTRLVILRLLQFSVVAEPSGYPAQLAVAVGGRRERDAKGMTADVSLRRRIAKLVSRPD
jgi:hypothetical protein